MRSRASGRSRRLIRAHRHHRERGWTAKRRRRTWVGAGVRPDRNLGARSSVGKRRGCHGRRNGHVRARRERAPRQQNELVLTGRTARGAHRVPLIALPTDDADLRALSVQTDSPRNSGRVRMLASHTTARQAYSGWAYQPKVDHRTRFFRACLSCSGGEESQRMTSKRRALSPKPPLPQRRKLMRSMQVSLRTAPKSRESSWLLRLSLIK